MKNIFADLYNKVVNFFYKTDSDAANAKDVACSRLKLVLMQDRTNLPPVVMDRMKRELIELLSKYVELDQEMLDLNFEQEDNQMALMLSIPVIRAKDDAEIQAIIEKEALEKQRLEDLSVALGETEADNEKAGPGDKSVSDAENETAAGETPQKEDEEKSAAEIEDEELEEKETAANSETEEQNEENGENSGSEPETKDELPENITAGADIKEENSKPKHIKSDSSKTKAVSAQNKAK